MTQEQVKTMLRELIERGTYFILEVSEISSFDGSVSNREIAMVWNDSLGKSLRVQLSNASMMPGEVRFFYNDGIHLPYYRSVFSKKKRMIQMNTLRFLQMCLPMSRNMIFSPFKVR